MMKRPILFLLVCVPLRLALAYAAFVRVHPALWVVTAAMGLGMMIRQYQRDTGRVPDTGFNGGPVYWNSYMHGSVYIAFSVLYALEVPWAWTLLLADVMGGAALAAVNYA